MHDSWPPGFGPAAEPLPDLSGHPTAPGPLDPDERQQRRQGMALGRRHGPGIPGMTPAGPAQPGSGWREPS